MRTRSRPLDKRAHRKSLNRSRFIKMREVMQVLAREAHLNAMQRVRGSSGTSIVYLEVGSKTRL